MRFVLTVVLIVLAVLLVLVLGTGLVVLLAYGLGWFFSQFLPLTLFEATLVSLIGIAIVGAVIYQIAGAFISGPVVEDKDYDEWLLDDDDWDEDWDDLVETQDASDSTGFVSGVPRWRQARPKPVYYDVGRNEPCPCGSGKKFKHCHGAPRS